MLKGATMKTASPAEYGAAWLDEHHPGWASRINLTRLDIRHACDCILGQVFPSYLHGVKTLPGRTQDDRVDAACRLGFDTLLDNGYDELTAEWSRLVATRQAAVAEPVPITC